MCTCVTYIRALLRLVCEQLIGLHDNQASNDGIRGRDGGNNITCGRFNLKAAQNRQAEDMCADICRCCDEGQGREVVFAPLDLALRLRTGTQLSDTM